MSTIFKRIRTWYNNLCLVRSNAAKFILNYACLTDKGGRDINQDYAADCAAGRYHCWLVADGLGGHGGGEIASALVCKTILACFSAQPSVKMIDDYFYAANEAVLAAQMQTERCSAMQSTIVGLVTDSVRVCWGHIGDSRLYMFRDGKIIYQTKDHSVPQALADAGKIKPAEIRQHEDRNRLLRALGSKKLLRGTACVAWAELRDGDAFLLCTDGFWDYVYETEMLADWCCAEAPADWLKKMEKRLQMRVNGKFDNYTAVAVWVSAKR